MEQLFEENGDGVYARNLRKVEISRAQSKKVTRAQKAGRLHLIGKGFTNFFDF